MSSVEGLTVVAPAKVTLSLRVLGTRSDGFHELEALVVAASDPHDVVALRRIPRGVELHLGGPMAAGVPIDDTNLAVRAARAVVEVAEVSAGTSAGLSVTLTKNIAAGGGLGGGSSDAAAVLRAAGVMLGVDQGAQHEIATELGSDVPVCLIGGAAWMRGRGEWVDPVELDDLLDVVIVTPPFGCSTPLVFQAYDDLYAGSSRSVRRARTVSAPAAVSRLIGELVNDLEPAAERVEPRLVALRDELHEVAGVEALLAGSGSTFTICATDAEHAHWMAQRIAKSLDVRACRATAPVQSNDSLGSAGV